MTNPTDPTVPQPPRLPEAAQPEVQGAPVAPPSAPVGVPAPVPPVAAPVSAPVTSAPVPPADAAPVAPAPAPAPASEPYSVPAEAQAVFADGAYTAIKEPRNPARLALDGAWHQISKNYVRVQFISHGIFLLILVAVAVALHFTVGEPWIWIPAGVFIAIQLFTMIILPRQARAYGFMLRSDDIVFRRGILWQRMVAVPYGRMQLVDVTHGPLDRAFGIAQLKLVTAAATTGATIPGLSQQAAEQLRDTLIEVSETRRAGL